MIKQKKSETWAKISSLISEKILSKLTQNRWRHLSKIHLPAFLQKPKYYLAIHLGRYSLLRKESSELFFEDIGSLSNGNITCEDLLSGKKGEVITGLSTDEVIHRNLILKLNSKRELLATLPFQVESILPYPLDEVILLPDVHYQKHGQSHLSLLAASKKTLLEHVKTHHNSDIVSCLPLALYRYARHFFPEMESFFLIYENLFLVVQNKKMIGFQAINDENAKRVLALMQKNYPEINPTPIKDGPDWAYAAVLGLALDAAIGDSRSGQFRQDQFISEREKKAKKKHYLTFYATCACFVFFSSLFSHIQIKKREKSVLNQLGYPSSTSLQSVADELEENLYRQKKETIAVCMLPKVSEILTWLSTNENLQKEASINRFKYQLTEYPKLGVSSVIFRAKVELELKTQNPKIARNFYESLLRNTDFVDQNKEVQWAADHGLYKAIFHIKPAKS